MSSYQNRNPSRQRSRNSLDRKMDKWIQTGKQVVDGVAGNRPGNKKRGWQDRTQGANFEKVGRWMEEKIDWFFEDDEDWLDNEELEDYSIQEINSDKKRPLAAISLRGPKALPPQINKIRNDVEDIDQWPDEQSFKLDQWQRKDQVIEKQTQDFLDYPSEHSTARRRNLPRSSRRR